LARWKGGWPPWKKQVEGGEATEAPWPPHDACRRTRTNTFHLHPNILLSSIWFSIYGFQHKMYCKANVIITRWKGELRLAACMASWYSVSSRRFAGYNTYVLHFAEKKSHILLLQILHPSFARCHIYNRPLLKYSLTNKATSCHPRSRQVET
jgi:hypothetical protein